MRKIERNFLIVNMDRIKIVPTIYTPSDIMVITDPKEEIIQKFLLIKNSFKM